MDKGEREMSEKNKADELEEAIICKVFDLEGAFLKASQDFRDLARLLMRYKKSINMSERRTTE